MYISIDMGGTNTRVASSFDLKSVYKYEKFPSDPLVQNESKLITSAIATVSSNAPISAICAGVPGLFDQVSKTFVRMANYHDLDGRSFGDLVPVKTPELLIENDAFLAAYGEAARGAGSNFTSVAYITLSTGVGGAHIVNKEIPVRRVFEPGNQIISEPDEALGDLVSGRAFLEKYGVMPEKCESLEIWKDYAKWLAIGLNNIIVLWNPDVIVLGGGISNSFGRFYEMLLENITQICYTQVPPIKQTALGEQSGIIGGFEFISKH